MGNKVGNIATFTQQARGQEWGVRGVPGRPGWGSGESLALQMNHLVVSMNSRSPASSFVATIAQTT